MTETREEDWVSVVLITPKGSSTAGLSRRLSRRRNAPHYRP